MRVTKLFSAFFHSEKSGGIVLVLFTALSLIITNSNWGEGYLGFWNMNVAGHSLSHWINDGLMAIFFLLIGLELEREIYIGELSNPKEALLPVFGAIGGMLIPAGIYLAFNYGTPHQSGAGIPMATDIAFAIGILSLLGNKVPASLKIFLTALAVIDDLGAILVIAVFYTKELSLFNLAIALGIWGLLFIFNRLKVRNLIPYLLGGVAMWYFMLQSGVHATITGVILAFVIPFGSGGKESTSYILQKFLHIPVAFIILPVFALANTAIVINGGFSEIFSHNFNVGIFGGLVIGKPIGIFLLSLIAVSAGLCKLPEDVRWKDILGVGFLGGIGFTMSIFITLLAFDDHSIIDSAKLTILVSSLVAGLLGFLFLKMVLKKRISEEEPYDPEDLPKEKQW